MSEHLTKEEATSFFAEFYHGEHHIPRGGVKDFGYGWVIKHDRGDLATYDYDQLTRLVLMAHDKCIRVSIMPYNFNSVKIAIWKRKREGGMSERHPAIEHVLETYNQMSNNQLPAEVQEQTKTEAIAIIEYLRENYKRRKDHWTDNFNIANLTDEGVYELFKQKQSFTATDVNGGEVSGATDWKAKYDEAQKLYLQQKEFTEKWRNEGLGGAIMVSKLQQEHAALKDRSDKLLEVLEQIVHARVPANEREYISWFVTAKNIAGGAISNWAAESETLAWKEEEEYPKLTPEQIEERKAAIDWYRNPDGKKEAVEFAQWIADEGWKPRIKDEWARYITIYSDVSVKSTTELYKLYKGEKEVDNG
jgi:acyl-CoA-binding protein